MLNDARIQIRLDSQLKRQAETVLATLGMDMTTAIRLFLTQTVIQNGLPFGMMNLDADAQTCTNQVTRELLITDGHAYEVMRTKQTCALASPATRARLEAPRTQKTNPAN